MALTAVTLANSDVVAGQKFYAENYLALIAQLQGFINEVISEAIVNAGNQAVGGVKTFSSSPVVPTPTTDMQAATKKYADDNIPTTFYVADGSTVFNTSMSAASTFQDLDLSAKVGSNVALVFLEVKAVTGDAMYACKPKGYGGAFTAHDSGSGFANGASYAHPDANNNYFYVVCATDSSGKIQHGSSNGDATFTIKLVGYIK